MLERRSLKSALKKGDATGILLIVSIVLVASFCLLVLWRHHAIAKETKQLENVWCQKCRKGLAPQWAIQKNSRRLEEVWCRKCRKVLVVMSTGLDSNAEVPQWVK
ncbi:hypothetical protein PM082_007154 [Marasmius tenuissimus]|nr:hypothetical protein PM082_007154 [Marasmius tenuissimus]